MAPYDNSLWFVETNTHPLLSAASAATAGTKHARPEMVNYIRPSFWSRFWELQSVMWETNAGLTERHAYDSRPSTWPALRRGINFWVKDHRQIYFIGNPVIWYAGICAVMVYAGARVLLMLRSKRGFRDFQDSTIVFYDQAAGFLALGWAMHYLPFFAMSRQLFIHHYLPALYFSILLVAVLFDVLTSGLRPKFRFIAAIAFVAIAFASYSAYAPLTYATPWTRSACERSRLLKTWDFNCREFPEHYAAYANYGPGIHTSAPPLTKQTGIDDDGPVESSQAVDANAAQAGNHPFEQVPKLAAHSGVAQASGGAAKVAPGVPAAGDAQPAAAVPGEASSPAGSGDVPGRVEGLDQEGIEAIVLGGTAEGAPPARSRLSEGAARESAAAIAPSAEPAANAAEDDVRIGHDDD